MPPVCSSGGVHALWPRFSLSLEVGSLLILGKGDSRGFWGRNLGGWAGPLLTGQWGHWSGGWAKLRSPRKTKPYLTVRRGSAKTWGQRKMGRGSWSSKARMTLCGGSGRGKATWFLCLGSLAEMVQLAAVRALL